MSTYTQIYYHVVFATKGRVECLEKQNRERLFRYIWGILKNRDCKLYRINAEDDHLHMLFELHPTIALANLVREIKSSSSKFISEENLFPMFRGWQEGYGAFTKSHAERDIIIEYIRNQEEHHREVGFIEELTAILKEHGLVFDDRHLP